MGSGDSAEQVWVGFDLGGTKMLAAVYDSDFRLLGQKRRKTRDKSKGNVPIERLLQTIEDALEDAGADRSRVAGIGAGCPGPLDLQKGVILQAPNLGWKDVPLQERLSDHFSCPAVICNDVDAGLFGEYTRGAARKARCAVGIFPGTGIGGACIYEGRIFRGTTASCMEVGFMQMATAGAAAGIGPQGTLEGLASRLAVAAEAAKAVYRGQAPVLAEVAGTDLANIRSGALSKSIEGGDKVVERIVRDAARLVGCAVGTLINLLAPDVVVMGGGLVDAMPKLYRQEVSAGIERNALPSLASMTRLRCAELGDYAGVIGAAAWVRQETGKAD